MKSLISYLPFSDHAINAIGWTLIHSLWQGLVLAILTGVVIQLTRKQPALVRYQLLTALLLVFLVTVAVTVRQQWSQTEPDTYTINPVSADSQPVSIQLVPGNYPTTSLLLGQATAFINTYANWIVALWLFVACLRFIRLGIQMGAVQRLKTRYVSTPTADWQNRFQQLAIRLHLTQPVALLESGLADMPMVVGFIKPVILVPLGMLSQLPADEVEAILWHELAHLKRKDYLVNLLQHGIEILFFFNPAVLWLSSLIRDEREHCCDDLAVSQLSSRKPFIKALIAFQETNQPTAPYAVAFGGPKRYLLNRVKRILLGHNQTLTQREMVFVVSSLFVTSLLLTAFVQKTPADSLPSLRAISHKVAALGADDKVDKPRIKSAVSPVQAADVLPTKQAITEKQAIAETIMPSPDALPTPVKPIMATPAQLEQVGQKLKTGDWQGRVLASVIAEPDTVIPDKKPKQEEIQSKIDAEIQLHKELEMRYNNNVNLHQLKKLEMQSKTDATMQKQKELEVLKWKEQQLQQHSALEKQKLMLDQKQVFLQKERTALKQSLYDKQAAYERNQVTAKIRLSEGQRALLEKDRWKLEAQRVELDSLRQQLARQKEELRQKGQDIKPVFDDMISFLQTEGVIKDTKDLSFKISNNELIVNYQRQSAALLEKFLKTHKLRPSESLLYNYDENRMR